MVTISISEVREVSASLLVTPLSFKMLPKKSMPRRGKAPGEINVVRIKATMGKIIFSSLLTDLGGFILITLSLLFVNKRMIGGCITGTNAIYE